MHELSLALNIVSICEQAAHDNHEDRIRRVKLTIGQFAGVEIAALQQGLQVASSGTVLEGATFEIARPPGSAWCMKCACTVPIARRGDPCPDCGCFQLTVNGGTELKVSEIEFANED